MHAVLDETRLVVEPLLLLIRSLCKAQPNTVLRPRGAQVGNEPDQLGQVIGKRRLMVGESHVRGIPSTLVILLARSFTSPRSELTRSSTTDRR